MFFWKDPSTIFLWFFFIHNFLCIMISKTHFSSLQCFDWKLITRLLIQVAALNTIFNSKYFVIRANLNYWSFTMDGSFLRRGELFILNSTRCFVLLKISVRSWRLRCLDYLSTLNFQLEIKHFSFTFFLPYRSIVFCLCIFGPLILGFIIFGSVKGSCLFKYLKCCIFHN